MSDNELRAALLTYVREIEVEDLDTPGPYGSRIRALHYIFTRLLALLPPADDDQDTQPKEIK